MADFIELTQVIVREDFDQGATDKFTARKTGPRKVRKTALETYGISLDYGNKFTEIQVNGHKYVVTETPAEIDAALVG